MHILDKNAEISNTTEPMNSRATALYQAIGRRIAEARAASPERPTQEQLSKRTDGLSRSAIANIESGRQRLALHQLYDLAVALQVPPAELLPDPAEFRRESLNPANQDAAAREFLENLVSPRPLVFDADSARRTR